MFYFSKRQRQELTFTRTKSGTNMTSLSFKLSKEQLEIDNFFSANTTIRDYMALGMMRRCMETLDDNSKEISVQIDQGALVNEGGWCNVTVNFPRKFTEKVTSVFGTVFTPCLEFSNPIEKKRHSKTCCNLSVLVITRKIKKIC